MEISAIINTLPYEAVINFTYRCNLSCSFCYQHAERRHGWAELTLAEWFKFIDELAEMQIFTVSVSGGEPFSHSMCRPLLERIAAKKMRFRVFTNGTLIGAAEAEFLAGLKRCAQIQLSLDGFEAEHDAVRGNGSFRKTLQALKFLTDAGLPVVSNTVVTRQNYRNMVEFAKFLETLPLNYYRLTPNNECCGEENISPAMLTVEELAELIAMLDLNTESLPHAYRHNLPFELLKQIRQGGAESGEAAQCSNTFFAFGVHPDGAVVPCPDSPEPIMGHVGEKPFSEIWNGEAYQDFRTKVFAGKTLTKPECQDCQFAFYCRKYCYLTHSEYYCRKKLAFLLGKLGVTC